MVRGMGTDRIRVSDRVGVRVIEYYPINLIFHVSQQNSLNNSGGASWWIQPTCPHQLAPTYRINRIG